jgi:hypothetical protein
MLRLQNVGYRTRYNLPPSGSPFRTPPMCFLVHTGRRRDERQFPPGDSEGFSTSVRQDIFGQVGLKPIDTGVEHTVPHFWVIVFAQHLRLDFDGVGMKPSAGVCCDLIRIDLDGIRPPFHDPRFRPVLGVPFGHYWNSIFRKPFDPCQHQRVVEDHDLAFHSGRSYFLDEQAGVYALAVEVQVQSVLGKVEAFFQGQQSFSSKSRREPGPRVKPLDFVQTERSNRPPTIRLSIHLPIMEYDVPTVFTEAHVNFRPFESVLHTTFERRCRVLRRLAQRPSVRHDLKRTRRSNRLEELEGDHGQRQQRANKQTQRQTPKLVETVRYPVHPCTDGYRRQEMECGRPLSSVVVKLKYSFWASGTSSKKRSDALTY